MKNNLKKMENKFIKVRDRFIYENKLWTVTGTFSNGVRIARIGCIIDGFSKIKTRKLIKEFNYDFNNTNIGFKK